MGTGSTIQGLTISCRGSQTSSDILGLSENKCVLGPMSGGLIQWSRMNPEQTDHEKGGK